MSAAYADALPAACDRMHRAIDGLREATSRVRATIDAMVARDARECPAPRRCVLVLHDDDAPRSAIAHAIATSLRVPVSECASLAHARVSLASDRPAVIVADYHLGRDTCAALLRDRRPSVRAVIVTGRVDLEALRPIADGVRAKLMATPTTPEEMAALVALVRGKLDDAAPSGA